MFTVVLTSRSNGRVGAGTSRRAGQKLSISRRRGLAARLARLIVNSMAVQVHAHYVRTTRTRLAVGIIVGVDEKFQIELQRVAVESIHSFRDLVSMYELVAFGVETFDANIAAALLDLRLYVQVDAFVARTESTTRTFVHVALFEAYLTLELARRDVLVIVTFFRVFFQICQTRSSHLTISVCS